MGGVLPYQVCFTKVDAKRYRCRRDEELPAKYQTAFWIVGRLYFCADAFCRLTNDLTLSFAIIPKKVIVRQALMD